jgi:hypothetical protein
MGRCGVWTDSGGGGLGSWRCTHQAAVCYVCLGGEGRQQLKSKTLPWSCPLSQSYTCPPFKTKSCGDKVSQMHLATKRNLKLIIYCRWDELQLQQKLCILRHYAQKETTRTIYGRELMFKDFVFFHLKRKKCVW